MTTLHRQAITIRIPRSGGTHEAVIVIIQDGALSGLGEAALVPGRDPARAMAAAEASARLDLEGRRRGVQVAGLLGGVRRTEIPVNALVTDRAPEAVASTVEHLLAAGFRTFKLKSADRGGDLDLARLGAARFAGGRTARLRIDFNGTLDLERAGSVLRSLAQFELELIEQPLPARAGLDDWVELGSQARLAADESLADLALGSQLAATGIGLAMKLATVGGPDPALRLAAVARGPVLLASSFETSIGIAAALHTACALTQEPIACGLATAHLLESDPGLGLRVRDGMLALPPGPGLGVELDWDLVDRYRLPR